jgi:hypothetical protein
MALWLDNVLHVAKTPNVDSEYQCELIGVLPALILGGEAWATVTKTGEGRGLAKAGFCPMKMSWIWPEKARITGIRNQIPDFS